MGIENRFLLSSEPKSLTITLSIPDCRCACAMTSHAHSLVLFRPQPTWRLGRDVQECGYISREKMTTGPIAMLGKRLFRQRGEIPKHLSIQHAITLQECRVFERYGVTITLMNLNQATTARLTLALHLLISKVNSNSLLC